MNHLLDLDLKTILRVKEHVNAIKVLVIQTDLVSRKSPAYK